MVGPTEAPVKSLRRLSAAILGAALLVVALAYVSSADGGASTAAHEAALPIVTGVLVLTYGAWLYESDRPQFHVDAVTTTVLIVVGIFAAGGFWSVYLQTLRADVGAIVGQQLLTAMSVGALVGVTIGHLYAESSRQHREKEHLSRAVNASMDGVAIVVDDDHVYANDAYAKLYGYADREAVQGRGWRHLYGEDARARIREEVSPVLADRDFWRGTLTGQRPDGSTFPKEVTITALDEGYVVVVRDVSEQREREQRIQVLNRVLRHNLRNAFTVIQGHANLIAEADEELADRHVDPIVDEATDLLETADKARGVERTLGRRNSYDRVQAAQIVRTVVERATAEYPEATVVSQIEESESLEVDPSLTEALSELVDNAVAHAERPDPRIEISAGRVEYGTGERIEFSVADDGPGLPEAERQALSAGEETQLDHGSGLGLWLVQWIVRSAGGDVRFSDRPGGGTVITLSLPLGVNTGIEPHAEREVTARPGAE